VGENIGGPYHNPDLRQGGRPGRVLTGLTDDT